MRRKQQRQQQKAPRSVPDGSSWSSLQSLLACSLHLDPQAHMGVEKWDPSNHRGLPPAPVAHLALALLPLLSYVLYIPYSVNVVIYAAVSVYAGSWRSVQVETPEGKEIMTHKEAAKFPIVGSCVLFGLFVLFKVLPGWLVNLVISSYISLMGGIAVHWVLKPLANLLAPARLSERELHVQLLPKLPFIMDEPLLLNATLPELLLWLPSLGLAAWYGYTKNWVANNYMGLAFCLLGIENIALGSPKIAVILLCGLFVYDIFWVFCTPVMVAVAKNLDAPIKLLFPRHPLLSIPLVQQLSEKLFGAAAAAAAGGSASGKPAFAMLGLGDIVVPGFWVALMLRYDVEQKMQTSYFRTVFLAYSAGLATTIWCMNYFNAAQPALLYIVPAILLAVLGHAMVRGEVAKLWAWHEEPEHAAKQEAAAAAAAAGKKGQ